MDPYSLILSVWGKRTADAFINRVAAGERPGQAFFNVLTFDDSESAEKLRGSLYDPYYKTGNVYIAEAVDYLTR